MLNRAVDLQKGEYGPGELYANKNSYQGYLN